MKSVWHTSASLRLMFQIINLKSQLLYSSDCCYVFTYQNYMSSKGDRWNTASFLRGRP